MQALQHSMELLRHEMGAVLSTTIIRLIVALLLGGVIGLERQLRRKPAGLRTNMFICFGSAMFTVMSDQLAGGFGGDHTRVAAQIIPGIGFIGAGSILHARGSVTGLTTAATLFVVASVGMAAGGGLYVTAVFATVVILIALALLGRMEAYFALKSIVMTYEVTGASAESVLRELNRILETENLTMQDVHAVSSADQTRVVFRVDGPQSEHETINIRLHESVAFSHVQSLGSAEHE
jgi:putative Mg2+ transporter-C (MgtC) family protein